MITRRFLLLTLILLPLALSGCLGSIERPVADFVWCPNGFAGDLDFQFMSTSTMVPGHWIESMVWKFDHETLPQASVGIGRHRFSNEGIHHVNLTVTDSRGISGTVTKAVPVFLAADILSDWQLTLGWPIRIRGIVANRADMRLNSVMIKAKFYDFTGVRITDGTVTIFDMDPGERVAFTVDAGEYSARIFYATVEVASFMADCGNPWFVPIDDGGIK